MAFSFAGTSPAPSAVAPTAQSGGDLEDIQTEGIGWLALSGESKVQLLPSWPPNQLPPPTASLLSIASHKGLLAAAGPDVVIVARTENVRKAFEGPATGDGNLKPFTPELTMPMPMRVSQLAFTADESYLVLSAENGGGLAVYDVQALLQGNTKASFEMSTNGQALRALVPNPTPEKGELLALVTNDGNLMMANLKERVFNKSSDGQPVLKSGVSSISWSTKGKQLVAGLGNGSAYQMTPEGQGKAEIPRPPNANVGDHVSSITWLENNCFLIVLTPSTFDSNSAPASNFYVVHRDPAAQTNFMFQKIPDPAGPFGMNRSPPHHFMLRLRDFPPNLQDVLVVSSTAATDIGLFSRSKVPLTNDKPADKVTGVFTMTEMSDDSRRAQLPMSADLNDTSPIGLAFDLSSKEKVHRPIPTYEEINESPTPLPALMVLNNEGVLASWWFIYSESIRNGTIYTGLVAAGGATPAVTASSAAAQAATPAFGGPAKPVFGTTFGGAPATASPGAFGGPSALGQNKSVWGSSAATGGAFGTSATTSTASSFGSPSFGQTSVPAMGLGNKASPWSTGTTSPNATFGQSGGLAKPATTFGTPTLSSGSAASGFASFATNAKGGFTAAPSTGTSVFGSKPAESPLSKPSTGSFGSFGANTQTQNPSNTFGSFGSSPQTQPPSNTFGSFGSGPQTQPSSTTFGTPAAQSSGIFGAPVGGLKTPSGLSAPFVLGSTFKADPSAKHDENEPINPPKSSSFFGGNFGGALSEVAKQPVVPETKDADMDEENGVKPEPAKLESTTPASTPAAPKTQLFPSSTPASGGLFGSPSTSSGPPPVKPVSAGFSFGQSPKPGGFFANLNNPSSTPAGPKTPTTSNAPGINPFAAKTPASPKIKQEPFSETPAFNKIPEAPLPPDPASKTTFGTGESSTSSPAGAGAPLPPDFIPKPPAPSKVGPSFSLVQEKKPIPADLIPPTDVPGGPEDDGGSSGFLTEDDEDDQSEGSGEDVAKDLSPVSETRPTPGLSPESSFGGPKTRSSESTFFGQVSKPGPQAQPRSLFGEVGASVPILPPPKVQQSPRSPSPIRTAIPPRMSRPDVSRSVSAPGAASQILGSQRAGSRPAGPVPPTQNSYNLSLEQRQAEEKRRAEIKAQKEAEETRALDDEEDDRIQHYLASDIQPTKILDEFEAYADRVNNEPMESIPAQVETVYRDINAMIDTLGLNARKMKSFIQGHTDLYKDEGRTRRDLEVDEEWCLVEIEDLSAIVEKELSRDLDGGRVRDVIGKLDTCTSLQKDIVRLRAKHEDVKKIVDTFRDPDQLATARAQPLSAEQSAQQNDLRRDFTAFQKLLSEAEEGLSLLKAKIVSQSTSQSKLGGTGPTVEAVMRTITKMTSMAEKRSGDIDVLEGQMRRLRFGSSASVGSREGSPFATPQKNNRASVRNLGGSSYGLFYTPDSIKETPQRFQSSMMSSTSSLSRSASPRKKMSGYTAEEKMALRTKLARKREATDKLKAALAKSGTHVRTMDDE